MRNYSEFFFHTIFNKTNMVNLKFSLLTYHGFHVMTMTFIKTFCSSFKVFTGFRKQTSKYYFNFFTLLKIVIIFDFSLSLQLSPIPQRQSIPKSCQVFFSSNPKCLLFYPHSQPSSGPHQWLYFVK